MVCENFNLVYYKEKILTVNIDNRPFLFDGQNKVQRVEIKSEIESELTDNRISGVWCRSECKSS